MLFSLFLASPCLCTWMVLTVFLMGFKLKLKVFRTLSERAASSAAAVFLSVLFSLPLSFSHVCCDFAEAGISLFISGTCLSVRQHFITSESLAYDARGSASCFLSLLVCSEVHVSFYNVVGGHFFIFRHSFVSCLPLWELFNWNPIVLWLPEEHFQILLISFWSVCGRSLLIWLTNGKHRVESVRGGRSFRETCLEAVIVLL